MFSPNNWHANIVDTEYADNGVFSSTQPLQQQRTFYVGCICQLFPYWLSAFDHSAFVLKWIVLDSREYKSLVQQLFPQCEILLNSSNGHTLDTIDILAVNGKMHLDPISPLACTYVLFDYRFRATQKWNDWNFHCCRIQHSSVGGVTSHCGNFTIAIAALQHATYPVQGQYFATSPTTVLNSILKCTEKGIACPPPSPRKPSSTVHSAGKQAIYATGLLPSDNKSCKVICSSVFSPTKWVRRQLSTSELKHSFDLSPRFFNILASLLSQWSTPCKVMQSIVNKLFLFQQTGGVSSTFSRSYSSTSSRSLGNMGLQNLPPSWLANERHSKKESAAVHDDAAVPLHLWLNSLQQQLGYVLSKKHTDSLNVLRHWTLGLWKRSVVRCFINWLKCRECHTARLKGFLNNHTEWKTVSTCQACEAAVQMGKSCCVNWVYSRYTWNSKGKSLYKKGWNKLRRKHKSDAADTSKSIECAVDCFRRMGACSEWKWPLGSRPFFWRWGLEFMKDARDGPVVYVKGELPRCHKRQTLARNPSVRQKVKEKIEKVRKNQYICKGHVESLTSYFDVPKDENDIRMVYNGTSSGLNDAVYAPWFAVPTVETHLRAVEVGTFMGDCDIGEMFLNFMLDEKIRPHAGVDLSELYQEENGGKLQWERWERCLMGFKPSPYLTTREMKKIEVVIRGNRTDEKNVFHWEKVVMNLPGSAQYNPNKPWVYKARPDGKIAAELFSYIDDYRTTGPSRSECWLACHRVGCMFTWFGIQDAARKRREASQTPGAWAGTIIHTDLDRVTLLVTQKKWDKTKTWLSWLRENTDGKEVINFKDLERCRGFLIYVSRTYRSFVPYLRGIHKTIDGWRNYRDEEGWKMMDAEVQAFVNKFGEETPKNEPGATVDIKPRLRSDVEALLKLTNPEAPPKVTRRVKRAGTVCYGFGDSSGAGFGNCISIDNVNHAKYGTWSHKFENAHSNFKELKNLVNAVCEAARDGLLMDAELFMFTDNMVAEKAYYNGGSNRNKELDSLVFQLWQIQLECDFVLHVFHVAGTRMIESGIDGLSRGELNEGVSKGESVVKFVPIHQNPADRSPGLIEWVHSWWEEKLGVLHTMTYEDWFDKVMERGSFLWMVPPAAGSVAVEQLCTHVHGVPDSLHVFIIPRLCTSMWRKQLGKCADFMLTIDVGHSFWHKGMHEPLLLAIYLPLLPPFPRFEPWRLKYTELVASTERILRGMQKESKQMEWDHLQQLLLVTRNLPSMSESMARKVLRTKRGRQIPSSQVSSN